jgi:hypothetical protein
MASQMFDGSSCKARDEVKRAGIHPGEGTAAFTRQWNRRSSFLKIPPTDVAKSRRKTQCRGSSDATCKPSALADGR